MKAILISIQPKWCELIASGKKTIEIRRSLPKLDAPFKVYIYCTLAGSNEFFKDVLRGDIAAWNRGNWGIRKGNVIGEFICSQISTYDYAEMYEPPDWERSLGDQYYITSGELECSCLSYEELTEYGQGVKLYGLHITALQIYDQPKPLQFFHKPCPYKLPDGSRMDAPCPCDKYTHEFDEELGLICCTHRMKTPPQSWCYVEDKSDG